MFCISGVSTHTPRVLQFSWVVCPTEVENAPRESRTPGESIVSPAGQKSRLTYSPQVLGLDTPALYEVLVSVSII